MRLKDTWLAIPDVGYNERRTQGRATGRQIAATPEQQAGWDRLLEVAGWHVCDYKGANIHAARGVAIREFPLTAGMATPTPLSTSTARPLASSKPRRLACRCSASSDQRRATHKGHARRAAGLLRPLPFAYESTGVETRFTNGLDPGRARGPSLHFTGRKRWPTGSAMQRCFRGNVPVRRMAAYETRRRVPTFTYLTGRMPELVTSGASTSSGQCRSPRSATWRRASPPADRARLIQMATGSGKTFTAISFIYRLIKYRWQRRRAVPRIAETGRQTKKEFDQYVSPVNNYSSARSTSSSISPVTNSISRHASASAMIQRMYHPDAEGARAADEADEESNRASRKPVPGAGADRPQPCVPDRDLRHHRYRRGAPQHLQPLWQVLEYFDAT